MFDLKPARKQINHLMLDKHFALGIQSRFGRQRGMKPLKPFPETFISEIFKRRCRPGYFQYLIDALLFRNLRIWELQQDRSFQDLTVRAKN